MSTPRELVLSLSAMAAGIGAIEVDAARRTVVLDDQSAAHHGLGAALADGLQVDFWLGLFVEADRVLVHALLGAGLPPGAVERLVVRVPAATAGQVRLLELSFVGSSATTSLVGASRDITAQTSREELRRQKAAAERASQAQSEFMSQVSHELRTPLNAILGFAQLMVMDSGAPLPTPQLERLDLIRHSGQRLLSLIDQLLQLGRLEQGRRHLKVRSIEAADVVRRCVESLQVLAQERGISIEVDDAAGGAIVRADLQALEQVLTNLLSNAVKYNRDRGRVRVRIGGGDEVQITVDDTGRGIPEAQLGRLFEPFNRLAAARTSIPGTGLGLVITKRLVAAMGGRLDVWSEVGTGSRFQIHLPAGRRPSRVLPASRPLPLNVPSRWDTGHRSTVLYVEDDDVNVLLMKQLFDTQPDWELVVAGTAAEGIALAKSRVPELILLDLNLPDASGTTVLEALKRDPVTRHVRCVAVSADALPERVAAVLRQGFEDYWTKPLDLAPTIDRLKRLLG